MRGFAKAAEKQLKAALSGPARKAGEEAGGEAGEGAAKGVAKKSRPAGTKFAEGFGKGVKSGLAPLGDEIGEGLGAGIGNAEIDTRPLRSQLKDMAAEVNADLRSKGLEFEVDQGRLAAIAKQVKATIESAHPEITLGARTSDVVAKVREQVTRDIAGVGADAGEKFSDGMEPALKSGIRGWAPRAGHQFAEMFSDDTEKGMRSRVSGIAGKAVHWFGNAFGVAAKPTAATLATAFSAQFVGGLISAFASGIAKLAHGLGAVAALLPAAAGAGILAFGTLKVAVLGVGDALSAGLAGDTAAFDKALKDLSPSARTFARSVAGMKDELDDLKSTVQENFFSQFADQTKKLGSTYLPVLKSAMGGVATSFGTAVRQSMGFLTLPKTSGAISMALGHMGKAIDNVTSAIAPMIRAFLPLVTVGSTFLPGLTGGLEGAANRLADFMEHARDTGKLAGFIQGGLDKLRELWETAKQLGRIFTDVLGIIRKVFGAGGITGAGGGLLDAIESGVDSFNRFLESAKGAGAAAGIMRAVGSILNSTMGTLQRIGQTLGNVFGPIMPQILNFVEAFARLKAAVVDTALDALEPVLMALGAVLGGVVLPALTKLADWLADNQPVLQGIGIAIMTLLIPAFVAWAISAGAAAIATLLAMAPLILIGAAIAALAALFIIHWDTIKNAVATAFNWVKDNWPLLLAILTGPIGIAVLLIKRHWDTITDAVGAVIGFIGDHWRGLLQILTGPIGLAVAIISRYWDTIQGAVGAVIGWIGDHWALLLSILSLPLAIFAALVVTQWEHIRAFIMVILTAIGTAVMTVFTAIATVVTTVFTFIASVIMTVFNAIATAATAVFTAIATVATAAFNLIAAAVRFLGNFVVGVWNAIRGGAVSAWQAIWSKTASVRDAIAGAVSWLRDHIVGVFNSVRDGVAGAWSSIQGAISAVVDWIAGKVEAVMGMIGDIGSAISSIPGAGVVGDIIGAFDVGGVVPGPKGAPALAIVHGGETIVPTHDPGAMRNFATDQFTDAQHASISSGRVAGVASARLIIDVTGGPPEMVRLFKKMIRTEGQGDPVAYLTP